MEKPNSDYQRRILKMYLFQESSYSEQTIDGTLQGKYKDRADVRLVQIKAVIGRITAHD